MEIKDRRTSGESWEERRGEEKRGEEKRGEKRRGEESPWHKLHMALFELGGVFEYCCIYELVWTVDWLNWTIIEPHLANGCKKTT